MKKQTILLLGGVRSGKSALAARLAAGMGPRVLFVATAVPQDEEMQQRIAAHRRRRPATWQTLEQPTGVGAALLSCLESFDAVLLDCVSVLVANHFAAGSPPPVIQAAVEAESAALIEAMMRAPCPFILVSNEVGMGLVPPYPSGRLYQDLLGWTHQRLAQEVDTLALVIAGIPLILKGAPLPLPT